MEEGVFNPGAVTFRGQTLLLVRIEDRGGTSRLALARSDDGVTDWRIYEHPALRPHPDDYPEESLGIEDARITYLEALGAYAIAYTAYSECGPLVSLMTTEDFERFSRLGAVLPPENKDAALFPVQFDSRWAMLHRPAPRMGDDRAHIWVGYSPDLRNWGEHRMVLNARHGSAHWDSGRIGLSAPPMLTDEGWLLLYHSARPTVGGKSYRVGLALLDRDEPTRVLARSSEWILAPEADYELLGQGGIVFPCGWIRDGDNVRIYYGAGDHSVALAHGRISDLLAWLHRHSGPSD
jgi:predicted GH43/DUF377 family glycosyl hydrolase